MLHQLKRSILGIVFSLGLGGMAAAATLTDPTLYSDLGQNSVINLAGFDVGTGASGPATLALRYGGWTGGLDTITINVKFNGSNLLPLISSSGAYYSNPAYMSYDVSTFLVDGLNTISLYAFSALNNTTYAVGEVSLSFETAVVPLPASLPLILAGLGMLGIVARRRSRA